MESRLTKNDSNLNFSINRRTVKLQFHKYCSRFAATQSNNAIAWVYGKKGLPNAVYEFINGHRNTDTKNLRPSSKTIRNKFLLQYVILCFPWDVIWWWLNIQTGISEHCRIRILGYIDHVVATWEKSVPCRTPGN